MPAEEQRYRTLTREELDRLGRADVAGRGGM
jgi:hypothetical protein